jgi:hypothetical protein
MNKKVVQLDDYDFVELWADGLCRLRILWDQERKTIDQLVAGPLSLQATYPRQTPDDQEPGIVRALREEGI